MTTECAPCHGSGVLWVVEPEGQGTGEFWKDHFNPGRPAVRIRLGWYTACPECKGEGFLDKKPLVTLRYQVGVSVHLTKDMLPKEFGPNTRENLAWKIGNGKEGVRANAGESVWLSSRGVLLIAHGEGGPCEILSAEEIGDSRNRPAVKARLYAWLNHGTFTGPHVPELIQALEEYNALLGGAHGLL